MLKLSSYKGCRNERTSVGRAGEVQTITNRPPALRDVKGRELAAEIDLVENGYANSSRTI